MVSLKLFSKIVLYLRVSLITKKQKKAKKKKSKKNEKPLTIFARKLPHKYLTGS